MKKLIVLLFSMFLLLGAVGSAGATSFTIGNVWSILDRINSGSEFSNLVTPSAITFDLHPGGTFERSFLNTSYGFGGIMSLLNDIFDSRHRHKNVRKINKRKPPITPVPEPATILMVGIGLIGLAQVARKKIKP